MSEVNSEDYCIEGKAYVNNDLIECSILISGEKISKISKVSNIDIKKIKIGKGSVILPAGIDLHVHFRDWNESYKETILSGSLAALAGGITTVLDMPNTKPPVNTIENLKKRYEDFKNKSKVDFGLHIKPSYEILRNNKINEYFAVKFYEEDLKALPNFEELLNDKKAVFHAQFGLDEVSAVNYVLEHSKKLNNIRFAHISRAESIELIESYRRKFEDKKVYIEVTPHHTFICIDDVANKPKGYSTVRPPLALRRDNEAIINAINVGKIDFIASDHAPHSLEEKLSENPPPGYPSIEVMYSIFLDSCFKGIIKLNKLIDCLCVYPARYLGIKKGIIREGYYADLVIFNFENDMVIDSSKFISKSKFSPFDGWKIKAKIETTIRRGKILFNNGEFYNLNYPSKNIIELIN